MLRVLLILWAGRLYKPKIEGDVKAFFSHRLLLSCITFSLVFLDKFN